MRTITFKQAAQTINAKPRTLRKCLCEQGVFLKYKYSGDTYPSMKYIEQGLFEMKLVSFHRGVSRQQYNKTMVTEKGVEFLREFIGNNTVAANDN